jgi:hypothetical protein
MVMRSLIGRDAGRFKHILGWPHHVGQKLGDVLMVTRKSSLGLVADGVRLTVWITEAWTTERRASVLCEWGDISKFQSRGFQRIGTRGQVVSGRHTKNGHDLKVQLLEVRPRVRSRVRRTAQEFS